jgi:hypothetical protein
MGQPFGERDLLLIAAGKAAKAQFDIGRTNIERLDLLGRQRALLVGLEQKARQPPQHRDRDILVDRLFAEQHGAPAFGDIGDAGFAGGAGVGEIGRLAAYGERAAFGPQLAEQGAGEFELAAAHEAIDAEHLAAARGEGHVAIGGAERQAAGFEHDRRGRLARQADLAEIALFELLAPGADHPLDDPALVDLGGHRRGRDFAAIAENRDLVRHFQDVVEEMRNKDQAAAALLELDQHVEQPLDFRRRQSRCRLVENDDARAGEEHAGELDELLHADREIAEPGARVDVEAEIPQLLLGLPRHFAPGDDAEPVDRLHPEKDVLGDGELGRDR